MSLPEKKSEYVLQHEDGTFHAIQRGGWGCEIVRVDDIGRAKRFESPQCATNCRSNESHLRDIPLRILEVKYEVIDCGVAPLNKPDWED